MPDLRGFGASGDAGAAGTTRRTFAEDAVALLDALGIEAAGVIGHDWGGFAAYLLGLRHPDRVTRARGLQRAAPVGAARTARGCSSCGAPGT